MVTTHIHPLRAGTTTGALWTTLTAVDVLLPGLVAAFGLPFLARNHADPQVMGLSMVAVIPAAIAYAVLTGRGWAEVRMRVPGALCREHGGYSWDLAIDTARCVSIGAGFGAAVYATSVLSAASTTTLALCLGLTAGGLLGMGINLGASKIATRAPRWGHELASLTLRCTIPGLIAAMAITALHEPVARENGYIVGVGVLALLVLSNVGGAAAMHLLRIRPARIATDVRADLSSLVSGISAGILNHTNPSPTMDDHRRMERRVRWGIYLSAILGVITLVRVTFN